MIATPPVTGSGMTGSDPATFDPSRPPDGAVVVAACCAGSEPVPDRRSDPV